MHIASSLDQVLTPVRAALGNFDGVHLGHFEVIAPVVQGNDRQDSDRASSDRANTDRQDSDRVSSDRVNADRVSSDPQDSDRPPSLLPTPYSPLPPSPHPYRSVITFSPHPQEFFSGQPKALLTPTPEKAAKLAQWGIEQLILLPFNRELARLSPQAFVEDVLLGELGVQSLSVGEDFCFGAGRSGTAADLQALAARHGVPVTLVPVHQYQGERISSSAIRKALIQGDVRRAQALLGYGYSLQGTVIRGQQVGRTLGFPTANLALPAHKFLPRQGVYGVWVYRDDRPQPQAAVMNLGTRPTIAGQHQTLEVHLLDQAGFPDLYGQTLRVELVDFLRSEQKFESLDALKSQITQDCAQARRLLAPLP